ncbi:helix-turn-helix domain-containing protein [Neobacillus novalis]|uniref:Helix-turn-helix domain-containing protein n=1 Tax=Neobacillus novalis TaxID=220687 RepID=A0AA95MR49_9BACI|nr:helix-turn-helix domain-containing protein [Neobacillus novalis]WHY86874.1 helix-turn-helix domain-containing protein [Neobacillus novalis]
MAPKKKFSKDDIIEAAFEIAREEGIDNITVRKVADKIGSSIAPIYVNFTDVDELKNAVLKKIHDISQQMLMTKYSENPFLNIGIASLKFAREYKVLFKDLVMNSNTHLKNIQPPDSSLLEQMKQGSRLEGFTDEELADILFKMKVFQMGLSVMDVYGFLPEEFSEEKLIEVLEGAGKDVIAAARLRQAGRLD